MSIHQQIVDELHKAINNLANQPLDDFPDRNKVVAALYAAIEVVKIVEGEQCRLEAKVSKYKRLLYGDLPEHRTEDTDDEGTASDRF
jgi:phage tail sheath gpL-like